jgi:hypothetical protein
MQTLVALYDDATSAQAAVQDLKDIGISRDNISLVANNLDDRYGRYSTAEADKHVDAGEGAGAGAVFGGLTGFLVGLGALAIPGVGPVLAAGPLAAALGGAVTGMVAGSITGGIVGALIQAGIPENEAHVYAEGVRRGGTLLTVTAPDDWADRVEDTLNRHMPADVTTRSTAWQKEGWQSFNEKGQPYSQQDLENYRSMYGTGTGTGRSRYTRRYPTDRAAKV